MHNAIYLSTAMTHFGSFYCSYLFYYKIQSIKRNILRRYGLVGRNKNERLTRKAHVNEVEGKTKDQLQGWSGEMYAKE